MTPRGKIGSAVLIQDPEEEREEDIFSLPGPEIDRTTARELGEQLCERTVGEWACVQGNDDTANAAVESISVGTSSAEIITGELPDTIDRKSGRVETSF